jgi:hypothetical protein
MVGPITPSGTVAGVVNTGVRRGGWPASPVSVRWTLSPTHATPRLISQAGIGRIQRV